MPSASNLARSDAICFPSPPMHPLRGVATKLTEQTGHGNSYQYYSSRLPMSAARQHFPACVHACRGLKILIYELGCSLLIQTYEHSFLVYARTAAAPREFRRSIDDMIRRLSFRVSMEIRYSYLSVPDPQMTTARQAGSTARMSKHCLSSVKKAELIAFALSGRLISTFRIARGPGFNARNRLGNNACVPVRSNGKEWE